MDDKGKPYNLSTYRTFRGNSLRRTILIGDMRHNVFMRYVRAVASKRPVADSFSHLLSAYEALLEAESVFLADVAELEKQKPANTKG